MGYGSNAAMSYGVGCRYGLDLTWLWLWLWHRPAATAWNRPLAWEPPYAEGAALKVQKKEWLSQYDRTQPRVLKALSHLVSSESE